MRRASFFLYLCERPKAEGIAAGAAKVFSVDRLTDRYVGVAN